MLNKNTQILQIFFLNSLVYINKIKLRNNNDPILVNLELKKIKNIQKTGLHFKRLAFFCMSFFIISNTKAKKITFKSLINSLWNTIDSYTNIF